MAGGFYVGQSAEHAIDSQEKRYFYAIRRDEEGNLYFTKVDQLLDQDTVVINNGGTADGDFLDFEPFVDFFGGRDPETHIRNYPNIHYDQYRWDTRNLWYYIDDDGNLVVSVNQEVTFDTNDEFKDPIIKFDLSNNRTTIDSIRVTIDQEGQL